MTRVRRLQMIVLSMVIAFGLPWSTPPLSGQAKPSQAIIIDDTGSMVDELPGARDAAKARIDFLQSKASDASEPFPLTVILTFKDDVTTRLISNDPVQLKAVVDSLVPVGGGLCPESSLEALMRVAQMVQYGGEFFLTTDADSDPDGPATQTVDDALNANGMFNLIDDNHRNFLVTNQCPPGGIPLPSALAFESGLSDNHDPTGQSGPARDSRAFTAAALGTASVLGVESAVTTFSTLAGEGGNFVFVAKNTLNTAEGRTRYVNAATNMMYTAVLPTVTLVTPPAVPQDGTFTVELRGGNTNFQGSSMVSVGGTGVTVLSQSVTSPTRMLVNLSVSASAEAGFRDVTVTTNLGAGTIETARGVGALQITPAPADATIVGILPSQIAQGTTTNVTITGAGSHFVNGTSTVSLGTGVTVNSVAVSSPTTLTANVTVSLGSVVGFRDVIVTTGTEIADETVVGPLLIVAAPAVVPRILSATPNGATRSKQVTVTIEGENTHFDSSTTVVFGGAGITVQNVRVNSATSLVATASVAANAALGFRSILVTTGAEVAVLPNGFGVRAGTTHDLIADFGRRYGLWQMNGSTGVWSPFDPLSARSIVTGDLNGSGSDEVIVDFGPAHGIWVRADDSTWYQLHPAIARQMVTGDLDGNGKDELLIDFPGFGIWVRANDSTWYQLDPANASDMVTGDIDGNGRDEAIIHFPGLGIWSWMNDTSWFQLTSSNPRFMVVDDFDGDGREEVMADFAGFGIWNYTVGRPWSQVFPLNARRLAAGDVDGDSRSDLIADFGNLNGIWMLLNGAWTQLHSETSRGLLTSDLDNNGEAELIVDFGADGLWEYVNNADWIQVHFRSPQAIAAGHIEAP